MHRFVWMQAQMNRETRKFDFVSQIWSKTCRIHLPHTAYHIYRILALSRHLFPVQYITQYFLLLMALVPFECYNLQFRLALAELVWYVTLWLHSRNNKYSNPWFNFIFYLQVKAKSQTNKCYPWLWFDQLIFGWTFSECLHNWLHRRFISEMENKTTHVYLKPTSKEVMRNWAILPHNHHNTRVAHDLINFSSPITATCLSKVMSISNWFQTRLASLRRGF